MTSLEEEVFGDIAPHGIRSIQLTRPFNRQPLAGGPYLDFARDEQTKRKEERKERMAAQKAPRRRGFISLGPGGQILIEDLVRRRKTLWNTIYGINKASIRRLARRGGVKRISGLVYGETRAVLKEFLEDVIRDGITYAEHANRKTLTAMDVVYALKRQGRTIYGFGA